MEYNVFVCNRSSAHSSVNKHYVSKIDDCIYDYIVFMIIENKNDNENLINGIDFLMNVVNKPSIQKL
jgi:hypothetical protein